MQKKTPDEGKEKAPEQADRDFQQVVNRLLHTPHKPHVEKLKPKKKTAN